MEEAVTTTRSSSTVGDGEITPTSESLQEEESRMEAVTTTKNGTAVNEETLTPTTESLSSNQDEEDNGNTSTTSPMTPS